MTDDIIHSPWVAPGWHLAICLGCDPIVAQPFRLRRKRDAWAKDHTEGTGHEVAKAQGQ